MDSYLNTLRRSQNEAQAIIKREFEANAPDLVMSAVTFTHDETILVSTSDDQFRMPIGSDDDYFQFYSPESGRLVEFE